jgi:hypothetical protein
MPRWHVSRPSRTAKSSVGMGRCERCPLGKRRLRNAPCRPPPPRDLRCAKSAPRRTGPFSSSPAVASPSPPDTIADGAAGSQPGGSPFCPRQLVRGSSPKWLPAANARLASHSSRSNSREFALTLIVWMSQWPMRRTRGCSPFLYSLRWACRNKAYTSGARSSFISSSFHDAGGSAGQRVSGSKQ